MLVLVLGKSYISLFVFQKIFSKWQSDKDKSYLLNLGTFFRKLLLNSQIQSVQKPNESSDIDQKFSQRPNVFSLLSPSNSPTHIWTKFLNETSFIVNLNLRYKLRWIKRITSFTSRINKSYNQWSNRSRPSSKKSPSNQLYCYA